MIDLAWITALCLPVYFLGADAVGLMNMQEAFRATAAREMAARADWIVPTLHSEPYLAKPPMIYWAQLALARIRGSTPAVIDLRLTAAVAGWLGVVATYLVGMRLARSMTEDPDSARRVARWAAAGVAVGVLYVRSARMGELDILLAPFVVGAIGALFAAWTRAADERRTHWGAIAVATLCAAASALTKGPVPLAVIAVAVVPAIVLGAGRRDRVSVPAIVGAAIGAVVMGVGSARNAAGWGDAVGVAAHAVCGLIAGAVVGRMADPAGWKDWARTAWRCHLEIVIGAGVLAIWAWGAAVRARIGAGAVSAAAARQLEDNLRVLLPESPVNNLEFLAYGMLPIGFAAAAWAVWMVRGRERASRGALVLASWIVGGFILFSVAGKGVGRYLTPVWPAVAIAGGAWIEIVARSALTARGAWTRARAAMVAVVCACAIAQGGWYAIGRPIAAGSRSPRALADAVRERVSPAPDRVAIWDIEPLEFEYHFGAPIERWDEKSAGAMVAWIRSSSGPAWILAQRETDRVSKHRGSVRTVLDDAGVAWGVVESASGLWRYPPANTPVDVLIVEPGSVPGPGR